MCYDLLRDCTIPKQLGIDVPTDFKPIANCLLIVSSNKIELTSTGFSAVRELKCTNYPGMHYRAQER